MRGLLTVAVIAMTVPLSGAETTLGAGVHMKKSTPISAILGQPAGSTRN